jgi:hypothetical protein
MRRLDQRGYGLRYTGALRLADLGQRFVLEDPTRSAHQGGQR